MIAAHLDGYASLHLFHLLSAHGRDTHSFHNPVAYGDDLVPDADTVIGFDNTHGEQASLDLEVRDLHGIPSEPHQDLPALGREGEHGPLGGHHSQLDVLPVHLAEDLPVEILAHGHGIAFQQGVGDILPELDRELVKGALSGEHFDEYFFRDCKDEAIAACVKELKK